MNLRSNGPAMVSLGVGIGALVLTIAALAVGSVPVFNLVNWIVSPLQGLLASAAIVSGIVGFRTSSALYGVGKGAALAGFALGVFGWCARIAWWLFGLV